MGQSNAHPYVMVQMAEMLTAAGISSSAAKAEWNNHPGQAISYWYTTTAQTGYTEDMAYIDAIDSAFEIRAIFWIQGETNAAYGPTANFDTYTTNFLNAIISHLGYTPDINICKIWYSGSDSGILANLTTIRGYQDTVAAAFTGRKHDMKYYRKKDPGGTDDWHLNEHNYRMLGYDLLIEYAKWKTGII